MEKNVKSTKRCPMCHQHITKGTKITNVSLNLGVFYGGIPGSRKKKTESSEG